MRRPRQIRGVGSSGKRNQQGIERAERQLTAYVAFRAPRIHPFERERPLRQLGSSVRSYRGQYNLSRWLLKIEQDVDRPRLRIRLQEASDFVVMEGKAAECFLRPVGNKFVVNAFIKDGAFRNLPGRANSSFAFERERR